MTNYRIRGTFVPSYRLTDHVARVMDASIPKDSCAVLSKSVLRGGAEAPAGKARSQ